MRVRIVCPQNIQAFAAGVGLDNRRLFGVSPAQTGNILMDQMHAVTKQEDGSRIAGTASSQNSVRCFFLIRFAGRIARHNLWA